MGPRVGRLGSRSQTREQESWACSRASPDPPRHPQVVWQLHSRGVVSLTGPGAASHLEPAERIRSFPPFPTSLSLPQPVSGHLSQIPATLEKRVTVA